MLYTERLPPGRIAAHVKRLRPVGDCWAVERLCEGARAALENDAPAAAADLLERPLAEPSRPKLCNAVPLDRRGCSARTNTELAR